MGSKVIVFLGLFLAMVLLISSQAESSNTVDTSTTETKETAGAALDDAKYPGGGYGGYPGGGYGGGYPGHGGGYPGRGGHGGGYPGHGGHGGGYPGHGGHGGGYCRYGCCGRSNYKGGCRCCTYAGEKPDADTLAKPQN